jgi:hypothetical protein
MSAEQNKALVRRWFEGSTREERFEVSEQERGREAAERARAHLARAESELEAAQRFVDPGGGGETELALARALANARASVAEAMATVRMTLGEQDAREDELQRRIIITAQAKSDGLRLLRIINDTQAHGQEGARADPTRAAHEAGLDVGSERYQAAMAYLIEQAALLGDEHTAFDVGDQHPHGYASYFFTRRAVKLLEEE